MRRGKGDDLDDLSGARVGSESCETEPSGAPPPRLRGFAALSPEARRALGSRGGKSAHERGTANKFTSEAASVAGRVPHERGTAHKWTSEAAREAGRKGGAAARRKETGA